MYKPDFVELNKLVESGHLSRKEEGDLVLFNYTDFCTFERLWNEHTINSRGTIYNKHTGEVVAKALSKFFNLGELPQEEQARFLNGKKFEIFTKEDGSMGTVAFYNDKWNVTTRGSFNSDQAIKATQMLSKYDLNKLNKNFTYIVEIIYPENRIIVDYGPEEKLVLLACIETKTGIEADIKALKSHVPFPICKSHKFKTIDEAIEAVSKMDATKEGFVIRFKTGERIKLKSPDYLKIARLMSKMNPLTLWESMVNGKVSTELMMQIPEEFRTDYERFQMDLEYNYAIENLKAKNRLIEIENEYKLDCLANETVNDYKKFVGLYIKNNPHLDNQYVFSLITNKPEALEKMIMKTIRPTGNIL